MAFLAEQKRKCVNLLKTGALALAIFYFVYHTISGDKGLMSLIQLQQTVANARAELEEVQSEKVSLEHKVSMLYPQSLDLDLLDERARLLLGHVRQDEIIIMRDK